jgi:hypothetical protein
MGLPVAKKLKLIMEALDKHAVSGYGEPYELARERSPGARKEFENLYFIIGGVIERVEILIEGQKGSNNG